jgi:hypothetical protein
MERLDRYPVSDADFLSTNNGEFSLGFPAVNPGKSKYADRDKLIYVGRRWYDDDQTRDRVENLLRETAKNTKIKTDGSKVANIVAKYVKKAVYYLNKLLAKESGYIVVDDEPIVLEEMKESPYVYDGKGRLRGKIRGIYNTFTKKKAFNPDLAKNPEEAEAAFTGVHEVSHRLIQHRIGLLGEYQKFGPLAVPLIEAQNDLITDIVAPQVYSGGDIEKYLRTPRSRLPTA